MLPVVAEALSPYGQNMLKNWQLQMTDTMLQRPSQWYCYHGTERYWIHNLLGYEPVGVFLPSRGNFLHYFSETPMSPEHFFLVLQSGDWGVCEL